VEWIEKEIEIGEVAKLLDEKYEIQVDSPDGWVGVNFFIDKGEFDEYILLCETGQTVSCNENHLFETPNGWFSAKILSKKENFKVLTKNGIFLATVKKTGKRIPIVDINVNHENHRYYTNEISSHNTGVGKSLFLCHHASNCLSQGMNVLYITCEMAEERIAERIDANLLDTTLDSLRDLPKDVYDRRIESLKTRVKGKLIIKEYPTASANTNHFRILLEDLWLKKRFKPDIIIVDYLNICASSRMKAGAVNSYTYIKAIAEELRGLAAERNVPIWSATQVNRSGFSNTDIGLEDTSESFGLPATADFMFALISTEKLDEMNQIMVKQLKNRYNDTASNRKFVIGINRAKMKLYDISGTDQPMMAEGNIEVEEEEEVKFQTKFSKKKFSDWKV